jgi:hypothetical protein
MSNPAYEAFRLIRAMADTSSRAEKEGLLAELVKTEIGQFIIKWTYDPFATYGLTPPAPGQPSGQCSFNPALVIELLEGLATRKLSGHAAAREVDEVMKFLDTTGQEILYRILMKDLRCGIAATTINAVSPGLVPVFSVMPQRVEPKYDG